MQNILPSDFQIFQFAFIDEHVSSRSVGPVGQWSENKEYGRENDFYAKNISKI